MLSVFLQRNETENEGRSVKNIAITVSPVYIPPKIPKLQNGEAINYSPVGRYSTLDRELITKLDATKQIQDRYHPAPLSTSGSKNGQSSGMKLPGPISLSRPSSSSNSDSFEYSKPGYSNGFEYKPSQVYLSDKPISKPMTMEDYPSDSEISDKPPDSYKPDSYKPDSFYGSEDHDSDFSDFPPDSGYSSNSASKPIEFSGHLDHPPYDDDPADHDHGYGHELIYDHVPEYHEHHHHPHDQTEQPEMNDQRLDKRPYSYYFIGKKLWYVPLYFSIYFVIYIAALVLKSIARHKITFPAHLAEAVGHSRKYDDSGWWDVAGRVLEGIENFAEKFGNGS